MIDHDRLFKELLSTFLVEFIELFLPEMMAYLDPESITFLDKEVFTDVTAGEKYEADLLAQVQFKGNPSFFLIHVENQASNQANFGKRMFCYFARLYEKYDYPVYPIVVFSYDSPKAAAQSSFSIDFPDFSGLEFNYRVVQLNRLNWRDFLSQKNPVAAALMAKMAIAPADRPKVKAECLRLLVTLNLDPARKQLISGFVDTYLRLIPEEKSVFEEELKQIEPAPIRGEMMKIVTSWMEEGIEQGLEKGRQGQLRLVNKLLTARLGQLPAMLKHQTEGLTSTQLEQLGDQLLDFQTINALDRWLTRLEASEGFDEKRAEVLKQLRQQVGAIDPKQKQKLLTLSAEQWQTLATLNLKNIDDLDSWLSANEQ